MEWTESIDDRMSLRSGFPGSLRPPTLLLALLARIIAVNFIDQVWVSRRSLTRLEAPW